MACVFQGLLEEKRQMFDEMCVLRIYVQRGASKAGKGFWGRLFSTPLTTHLLREALEAGIVHGIASMSQVGFTAGQRAICDGAWLEADVSRLPVCLELIGQRPLLERFLRDHDSELVNSIVLLERVEVMLPEATARSARPGTEAAHLAAQR